MTFLMNQCQKHLEALKQQLKGELKYDSVTRILFSTDASDYKELPCAVAWPRGTADLKKLLSFARAQKTSLTIRAAGTSLAGQVVSSGIIADISRYMNRILEINTSERWVRVEPGVVLDELNMALKPHGLFFGPETSTSSRCTIGGMVGNNSCGSHSLVYGSTREHLIELKTILSDGSEAVFQPLNTKQFRDKCIPDTLEGAIYRNISEILGNNLNKTSIQQEFPHPEIPRRNNGYALDLLLDSNVFNIDSKNDFNFCKLLAGSEGTLAIITEIKLALVSLPPSHRALVCIHHRHRDEAFRANLIALEFKPVAVEMMDNRILELTKGNLSQKNNRFFLEGDPGAVSIVEFACNSEEEIDYLTSRMINKLKASGIGYAYPVVKGKKMANVWALRKAGLGILGNMKGDARPVSLIEDTAVRVNDLESYINDLSHLLASYGKDSVYHAHIGTGELHIRPVLNLKDPDDVALFRTIGLETARLVKKYRGSLSGEHGDGRLRGEFIPLMFGEHIYGLFKSIKKCWDPYNLLNPGKITDTPAMNTSLRYMPGVKTREIDTIYDFSSTEGIIRAAEKCNGTADCRKSVKIGGLMCPSFMATGDEYNSTRARANVLREYMSEGTDPWNHSEIYDILDLCLSCKGCKSECPSGVDIAKMKSEFLQHWHDKNGIPLRSFLIAYISSFNKMGSLLPALYNFFLKNKVTSGLLKRIVGFAPERSIPLLYKTTFRKWIQNNLEKLNPPAPQGSVCLYIDEMTDYNDTIIGIKTVKLLNALNYRIIVLNNELSGRTFISKGFLRKAKKIAINNVKIFSKHISEDLPLVGIEPSAILSFRDEYPDLAGKEFRNKALKLASQCFMVDEFIANEYTKGRISKDSFTSDAMTILVHAHCQQKAVASSSPTIEMLSIPENYTVKEIPSGCCGMAGSFGYEKEHYELSKKIGELVLFPEIRNSPPETIIAAPGTSCRHHIKDGTGRKAKHPVEVLYEALRHEA